MSGSQGSQSTSRGLRIAMSLAVVALIALAAGLWWSKTVAFSKTARVQITVVDTYQPAEGTLYSAQFSRIDVVGNRVSQRVSERLAASRGGDADAYESDLDFGSEPSSVGIVVTAKGRTPSAARDLANAAAEVLVPMYTSPAGSTDVATFSATVVPAR